MTDFIPNCTVFLPAVRLNVDVKRYFKHFVTAKQFLRWNFRTLLELTDGRNRPTVQSGIKSVMWQPYSRTEWVTITIADFRKSGPVPYDTLSFCVMSWPTPLCPTGDLPTIARFTVVV